MPSSQSVKSRRSPTVQKACLALGTLLALAGCAAMQEATGDRVEATVQVFHALPEPAAPFSYALLPLKAQEGSLEYRTYAELLRVEFARRGWQEVPLDEADVAVSFLYGVGEGPPGTVRVPVWGDTGGGTATTRARPDAFGDGYTATTDYTPSYGVVGVTEQQYSQYTRRLNVMALRRDKLARGEVEPVYEGSVISTGEAGTVAEVMPYMVKALFEDFPGKSGSVRERTLTPKDLKESRPATASPP